MLRYIQSLLILLFFSSCGKPIDYYYDIIGEYGYHPYLTPMEHSGTGTLLAGNVKNTNLIAPPKTCFPELEGVLERHKDRSTLPTRTRTVEIDSESKFEFMKTLASASPSIRAGSKIHEVHSIEFKAKGIHVESLNTLEILKYYRNQMPPECKSVLNEKVNFVYEAVRVDRLEFVFYRKNKGRIYIDLENVNQYLDFSTDLKWKIEEDFKLIIEAPKYIAYKLGRLLHKDETLTFYLTESKSLEKWDFYKVLSISDEESLD